MMMLGVHTVGTIHARMKASMQEAALVLLAWPSREIVSSLPLLQIIMILIGRRTTEVYIRLMKAHSVLLPLHRQGSRSKVRIRLMEAHGILPVQRQSMTS